MNIVANNSYDVLLTEKLSQVKTENKNEIEKEKLQKACKDFESIFLQYLLKTMRPKVSDDNPFSGGKGEKMLRGLQNQALADEMAGSKNIGIADMLYKQMSKMFLDDESVSSNVDKKV